MRHAQTAVGRVNVLRLFIHCGESGSTYTG